MPSCSFSQSAEGSLLQSNIQVANDDGVCKSVYPANSGGESWRYGDGRQSVAGMRKQRQGDGCPKILFRLLVLFGWCPIHPALLVDLWILWFLFMTKDHKQTHVKLHSYNLIVTALNVRHVLQTIIRLHWRLWWEWQAAHGTSIYSLFIYYFCWCVLWMRKTTSKEWVINMHTALRWKTALPHRFL